MEQLDSTQRSALQQLQAIIGSQDHDTDVLIGVLQSLNWNVQHATELLLDGPSEQTSYTNALDQHFEQLDIEEAPQGLGGAGGGHAHRRSITQTLLALLSLPLNILSGAFRLILGILRIPILSLPFINYNTYRSLRQTHLPTRDATQTGAYCASAKASAAVITTSLDSLPSTSRRHAYPPTTSPSENTRVLPDFFDGTYEEALDICQKEGRIACIILVSDEHDDVPEFKRSTLTDSSFVRVLSEQNFVVWGGSVRDKVSWDAAQKLQATTYPFIAFVALQPRRNPSAGSSPSSPILTVLSRHHGRSVPESGPTSAQTLVHHLEHQLLPRVTPFLTRYKAQLEERHRDRLLREQQDKAFQDSARRDKERIEARIRAEKEEAERQRLDQEAQRREEMRMQAEKERQEQLVLLRSQWRRWMRRSVVPPEPRGASAIRLAIKLPGSGRVVRVFPSSSTLTALYAFADSQTIPLTMQPQDDPQQPPEGPDGGVEVLEKYIQSQAQGPESWWGFKLALSYPRREIKWRPQTPLAEAGLRNGEQLVMELMSGSHSSSPHLSDDEYDSESD
ncbi:hypothetical protein F5I97DRAFT_1912481 [Phlebopus sp. FC_14]|nr:hypothetical protein F5I97DRAFT_1912481 [Phlebopus sp. FC_14]